MSGKEGRAADIVRRDAADWVALFHDPDAVVDSAAFERWRNADPRHAAAYQRAERAWEAAALLGQTSFGRARGLPERPRFLARPRTRYGFAVAAVMAVAILGLFIGRERQPPHGVPQATELVSSVGQIRRVTLAEGSTVILDTDSVLRVAFTGGERRLVLARGRARFEVAHDADRPFVVLAGKGSVTARGTVFDVAVMDDRVKVVLLRGVVDVRDGRTPPEAARPAMVRLLPEQQMSFGTADPQPPRHAAAIEAQWTTGMLGFDRTRLADAIVEVNRYSASKVSLADSALGNLRITGAYRAGDVAGFAERTAEALGLRVGRTPQGALQISAAPATPAS